MHDLGHYPRKVQATFEGDFCDIPSLNVVTYINTFLVNLIYYGPYLNNLVYPLDLLKLLKWECLNVNHMLCKLMHFKYQQEFGQFG